MYENIKEQFKAVIRHSQGIEDPKVDYLFREWETNKAKFIDLFGGPIFEWPEPIEFTLDEDQKRSRAMEFANVVADAFGNHTLASFIDDNLDSFFDNKVSNGREGVPTGMKLLKAFKYFEPNKSSLRHIQDMASNIIQENKIKGTLCFSVHPLDYLSSSENTYNWRSCHSLDGEYRAGNLSYIVDNSTFMVYLKGADDQILPNFGTTLWNTKKWRMLIHANDLIMFAGRQYPFSSRSGIDVVLNILNNRVAQKTSYRKWSGWSDGYIDAYVPNNIGSESSDRKIELITRYIVYGYELVDIRKAVKQHHNALNFNDVLTSTCYKYPYYSTFGGLYEFQCASELLENPIMVGGEIPCLHCGEELISDAETMRCDECELAYGTEENDMYSFCECCGMRIYVDDAYYVGDDYVCESCYNKHCFMCECCGEVFYNEERMFVAEDNDEDDGYWYCTHCYHENRE